MSSEVILLDSLFLMFDPCQPGSDFGVDLLDVSHLL